MSSLHDILDVDVEPLEAQAHLRSALAAEKAKNTPQTSFSLQPVPTPSFLSAPQSSNPGPVGSAPGHTTNTPTSPTKPALSRGSVTGERPIILYGSHHQEGTIASGRRSSRSSDMGESNVRLTPVTGRVSKAKKGQPVHVCEECNRVFTRAEHLRRHALSHGKAKYPCSFPDCEKWFYRLDLLARHQTRHAAGEKAYRMEDHSHGGSESNSPESQDPSYRAVDATHIVRDSIELSVPSPGASDLGDSAETTIRGSSATFMRQSEIQRSTFGELENYTHEASPTHVNESRFDHRGPELQNQIFAIPSYSHRGPSSSQPYLSGSSTSNLVDSEQVSLLENTHAQISRSFYHHHPELADPMISNYDYSDCSWPIMPLNQVSLLPMESLGVASSGYDNPTEAWHVDTGCIYNSSSSLASSTTAESVGSSPFDSPSTAVASLPGFFSHGCQGSQTLYDVLSTGVPTFPGIHKPPIPTLPDHSVDSSMLNFRDLENAIEIVDVGFSIPSQPRRPPTLTRVQINEYLGLYRVNLELIFPSMHPELNDRHPNSALQRAMAAIGTIFTTQAIAQEHAVYLHDECKKSTLLLLQHPTCTVQTFQMVLLTEMFARLRSQKVDVRLSRPFEVFYGKILDVGEEDVRSCFANINRECIRKLLTQRLQDRKSDGRPTDRRKILDEVWREWLNFESRQRLRCCFFLFDVHQALCHEQPRCRPEIDSESTFLKLPCPSALFEAATAQEWYEGLSRVDATTRTVSDFDDLPALEMVSSPLPIQQLLLSSLVTRLPQRCKNELPQVNLDVQESIVGPIMGFFSGSVCAHGYLALHYTPLRQLLGLTGSTFVFGRKLTCHREIEGLATVIREWASSLTAAHATWHACHALQLSLIQIRSVDKPCDGPSEYWMIYTSALVCWAFGHCVKEPGIRRAAKEAATRPRCSQTSMPKTAVSSTSGCIYSSTRVERGKPSKQHSDINEAALAYCAAITELRPEDLLENGIRLQTGDLLKAVRMRLEIECMDGRSMCGMLIDACGVLDRLLQGGQWF